MFPRPRQWTATTIHSFRLHPSRRAAWPVNNFPILVSHRTIHSLMPLKTMRSPSSRQQPRLSQHRVRLSTRTPCQPCLLLRPLEPLHLDQLLSRHSSNRNKIKMFRRALTTRSNRPCRLLRAQDLLRLNLNSHLSKSSSSSNRNSSSWSPRPLAK